VNPTSALSSLQNSNPLLAILWAGFTRGTLDISAAFVVYRYLGRPPMRLLKGSAAGSEVGDGLMELWSDGRPTESYPETGFWEIGIVSSRLS
jgi:hypothetical protein